MSTLRSFVQRLVTQPCTAKMRSCRPLMFAIAALAPLGIGALVPAHAQVVYDNGTYGVSAWNFSDYAAADDFLVTSSLTFNAISFYALDFDPTLLGNFSGTLSWYIHTDNGGPVPNSIPSTTIVASGTTSSVTVTDTGDLFNGNPNLQIAQLTFSIPTVNLGTGRYWLHLKEGNPSSSFDGSAVFWLNTANPNTGNGYRADENETAPTTWIGVSTFTASDLSYQLLNVGGTAANSPEPASLALLALGTAVGAVVVRRTAVRKK